jgi:hypothetical protein
MNRLLLIWRQLWAGLNTSAGLLILGFVVTTGGGALLNWRIQSRTSENERNFQMYKTRLEEAKALEKDVLEQAATREFYMEQVLNLLADENKTPEQIEQYWDDNYHNVKDAWNKNLDYWHAQMQVLFCEQLADGLVLEDENRLRVKESVDEYFDASTYWARLPRSLQGAFRNAHATMYTAVFKCREGACSCEQWKHLLVLATRQVRHVRCLTKSLADGLSEKLLTDPYGPSPVRASDPCKRDPPCGESTEHDREDESVISCPSGR